MRRVFLVGLGAVAGFLAISTAVRAGGPDPADYPLRVHVLKNTSQPRNARASKSLSDSPDYIDGMGVADLFEAGEPQGFEFSYSCMGGLKASVGYGTYPARWKKRAKTLEILVPQAGKPWNLETCGLRAEMRPGLAFVLNNDQVAEEAAKLFKEWMLKHQYNPEKDQNDPVVDGTGPFGETN
ncbi:MAG: hypothetical protein ABR976_04255 [Terracidiphilus sp.]|jgi:hypothetical protein